MRTTDPALGDFLNLLYAPLSTEDAPAEDTVTYGLDVHGERRILVSRDDTAIGSPRSEGSALRLLTWAINRQVILRSLERPLLHAAAADLDGAAVLLPAAMESGKTTLVTGLLDRGLTYLTDEAVAVTDSLTVEGYPKPLSLEPGSWQVLAHHRPVVPTSVEPYLRSQWHVPVQTVAPVARRSRPALIVFPRYELGARLRFERVGAAETTRLLVACAFTAPGTTISSVRVRHLAGIAAILPAYQLVCGDLSLACDRVIAELQQQASTAPDR